MKNIVYFFFFTIPLFAQTPIDAVLKKYNKESVPYISIKEFNSLKNPIILDTREVKEYDISHINNAICVGYDKFNSKTIKEKYKNQNDTIIVYCSLGIRSEKIGEKLQKMGYKNVFNLYGGIFEWKNNDQEVIDNTNKVTENIHVFSKEWSKYLLKGKKKY